MTAKNYNPADNMLKYKQVERQVRRMMAQARVGDKLPTERALAKMFDCNVLTVRKGMQVLVDENLLSRRVGSGTFVAKLPGEEERSVQPALEYIAVLNHAAGGAYSRQLTQAMAAEALCQNVELRSVWTLEYGEALLETVADIARNGCKALVIPWFPAEQTEEVRSFAGKSALSPVLPLRLRGLEHLCFEDPEIFGKSAGLEVDVLYKYFMGMGMNHIHFIGPDKAEAPLFKEKITAFVGCAAQSAREPVFGLFDGSSERALVLAKKYKEFSGDLAIISYDDSYAVRFMTAMHKLGLSAPNDFRIVGHNESSAARNAEPPLSTIPENFEYLGKALLTAATSMAAGKMTQSTASLNPKLLVRSSCGGRDLIATLNIPQLDFEIEPLPKWAPAG